MSSDNDIVIRLCGEYPEGFEKLDIESNPNFVFTNDSGYETINLYDYDENVVSVNSFAECEHYVTGGWDLIPEQRNETFYLNSLLFTAVFLITFGIIYFIRLSFKNAKE